MKAFWFRLDLASLGNGLVRSMSQIYKVFNAYTQVTAGALFGLGF